MKRSVLCGSAIGCKGLWRSDDDKGIRERNLAEDLAGQERYCRRLKNVRNSLIIQLDRGGGDGSRANHYVDST